MRPRLVRKHVPLEVNRHVLLAPCLESSFCEHLLAWGGRASGFARTSFAVATHVDAFAMAAHVDLSYDDAASHLTELVKRLWPTSRPSRL